MRVRPKADFNIPINDGYQLYSAFLSLIKSKNPELSKEIHDMPLNSMAISGIKGRTKKSDHKGAKVLLSDNEYKIEIGIVNNKDGEFFDSFLSPIILNNDSIHLNEGELYVEEIISNELTIEELFRKIKTYIDPTLNFNFLSPTCIQYKNSKVTEMFPHRISVFNSLISKWNNLPDQNYKLGINRDDLGRYLIEKPDLKTLRTCSILTNTVIDSKRNHPRPIFKQGFTGKCQYIFSRNAPESFKNSIVALSLFSEYSGIGSGVARGCGNVKVSIEEN